MRTTVHVSTSAILAGAIYAYSRSVPMAASCLVSGILIDLDHVVDFFLFSGEKFTRKGFFSWCLDGRWEKVSLLFHSYELFGMACLGAYYLDSAILRGLLWGAGLHLLLDQFANSKKHRLSPWFYLLSFRVAVGFRRERLKLSS